MTEFKKKKTQIFYLKLSNNEGEGEDDESEEAEDDEEMIVDSEVHVPAVISLPARTNQD